MPPASKELLPSFLDRLIDAGRSDASGAVVYTLEEMIDSVRADLEELLNTRQAQPMSDCPYPLVKHSILAYGLPDLNSIPGATARDSDVIGEHIAGLIELFEPRLKNVRVEIETDTSARKEDARQLRFQISASLNVDPAPEVGFETIVELSTGQTKVQTSAGLS
jgi:type VI secretion system protein ImpF